MEGYLAKGIQTPMAQGRSTEIKSNPQAKGLQALEAMGFTDRARNLEALRRCNNSLEAAVECLL